MSIIHRHRGPTADQVSLARAMLEGSAEPKSRRYLREALGGTWGWTRVIARELEAGNIIERHSRYEITAQGRKLYKRWDAGLS